MAIRDVSYFISVNTGQGQNSSLFDTKKMPIISPLKCGSAFNGMYVYLPSAH